MASELPASETTTEDKAKIQAFWWTIGQLADFLRKCGGGGEIDFSEDVVVCKILDKLLRKLLGMSGYLGT